MSMITEQEANERYGSVNLKFVNYYKFAFSFGGIAPDGAKILGTIGGEHGDIYRLRVEADKDMPVGQVGEWPMLSIELDGKEIFKRCDW